jgi:hypothetical protein
VITIPDHQYAGQIDSLLQDISNHLENNGSNFTLPDNVKHFIAKLNNVTVYGSETCIDTRNTPLLTVLTTLEQWKKNENFHHPLIYTMRSLRSLCTIKQFPEFNESFDRTDSYSGYIYFTIANLNVWKKYLKDFFEKFPNNFSNDTLSQQSKELQWKFSIFWNVYQEFQNDCRKILVDVRRKRRQMSEIINLLLEQRYASLNTTHLEEFSHYVYRWHRSATFFERLNTDQVQYIRVMDLRLHEKIPVTLEHIEETLRYYLWKEHGCVFVFYSNDHLKVKEPAVWEGRYQELISKRQQAAQKPILVYADFTNCQCNLTDLTIVMLTMKMSIKPSRDHPAGKKSDHFIQPSFFR